MKTLDLRRDGIRDIMTRGPSRGITGSIPKGTTPPAPPVPEFSEAWVRVTASPFPNMARITWDLGGRPIGWLQSSIDLAAWDEAGVVGPEGFFDEPIQGPRKFFRIRLETNS